MSCSEDDHQKCDCPKKMTSITWRSKSRRPASSEHSQVSAASSLHCPSSPCPSQRTYAIHELLNHIITESKKAKFPLRTSRQWPGAHRYTNSYRREVLNISPALKYKNFKFAMHSAILFLNLVHTKEQEKPQTSLLPQDLSRAGARPGEIAQHGDRELF